MKKNLDERGKAKNRIGRAVWGSTLRLPNSDFELLKGLLFMVSIFINVALILFSWECRTYNLIMDFVRKYELFHNLASVWLTELVSQLVYCSHFKNCHPVSFILCKQTILTKILLKCIIQLPWKPRIEHKFNAYKFCSKLLWGRLDFVSIFFSFFFFLCCMVYQHCQFLAMAILKANYTLFLHWL